MPTVTPPPPHVPSAPVSGPINANALVLSAPPQTLQALQALQTGQSLQAALISTPAANQIQVQTALGLLTLQSPMSVPRGAVLTLVLTSPPGSAQPNFQVSAVNGKPVAGGAIPVPVGAAQPAPPPLIPGQTVTATLLRPALGLLELQQGLPQTTSGTPGTRQQSSTPAPSAPPVPPTPQAAQGAAAPAPSVARATAGVAPSPTPTAPSSGGPTSSPSASTGTPGVLTPSTTTLPSGTRFSATVQRIEAPNAAVTTPAATSAKALATGQVLSGAVTGRTAGGQPIVQTPAATFALGNAGATAGQGALGEGVKVTFRLDSTPLAPVATNTQTALRGPGATHQLITAKTWDDLGEAFRALVAGDPARLAQVAQTALPQPGPKLSSQMLFFLTALKGGDLKGLFGDTSLRVIDKERPGLLARLGGDFKAMGRLADEPQQGDWRLALIPLWTGEQLEQVRFFWRGAHGEAGDENGEETRFVLDVELSNLGRLQIDGLVKAKRHHLDLIIRTDQPLPAAMRADIGQLFEDARTTLGLGGQVAFQAAPGNFVAVPGAQPGGEPGAQYTGLLA